VRLVRCVLRSGLLCRHVMDCHGRWRHLAVTECLLRVMKTTHIRQKRLQNPSNQQPGNTKQLQPPGHTQAPRASMQCAQHPGTTNTCIWQRHKHRSRARHQHRDHSHPPLGTTQTLQPSSPPTFATSRAMSGMKAWPFTKAQHFTNVRSTRAFQRPGETFIACDTAETN
jgi:hypothetical protein